MVYLRLIHLRVKEMSRDVTQVIDKLLNNRREERPDFPPLAAKALAADLANGP